MKHTLITTFCLLLLFSCSSNLSEQKAEELIKEKLELPQTQSTELQKSYYVRQYNEGGFIPPVGLWSGKKYNEAKQYLDNLISAGVISLEEKDRRSSNGLHMVTMELSLTSEGSKYLIDENNNAFTVKTHELDFGEITGIKTMEEFKIAEVDYTLENKNYTPFAHHKNTDPVNRSITIEKYDKSWKIN